MFPADVTPPRLRRSAAVSVLTLTLVAGAAPAQDGLADVEITTARVAGNVHALFGRGGNIGVLTGEDGAFLVDDQFAPLTPKILEAVRKLGGNGQVRFVVNTHWHGDHTGGNENLGKSGAVIVAHENVRERLAAGLDSQLRGRTIPPAPADALPVVTFADGVTFHWNGETVRVLHVGPAHTDGDSILHFETADAIHCGDLFFNGDYPFIDVESGGSFLGVMSAVDRLLEMAGPDTRLIPGHGPLARVADLRRYRAMLQTVHDRLAPLVEQGLSADELIAKAPLADLDEEWGNGFMGPENFLRVVHASLSSDD